MNYKKYLANGIHVSELGFGAWQLGIDSSWKTVDDKEANSMIHMALDNGINFFDTAPNYGNGTSELRLGKVFKDLDRSTIVINTKFGRLDDGTVDFDAKHIRSSIEKSLQRLQVDYLDSAIIHSPPLALLDGNKNDHYEVLEKLQDEGKIIAYGASIDFVETTNAKVIQPLFNIFHQDAKRAFDLTKENEVALIAKIPFDSGWLTGKYDANSQFEGVRARWSHEDKAVRAALVEKVRHIIEDRYSFPQAALSFCTAYDAISTVIPGAVSTQQLRNNIKAISHPLDEDTRKLFEDLYTNEVKELNLPW
jgi:aryl-alcohol dehydrogenase-like predicted oxidoreductase